MTKQELLQLHALLLETSEQLSAMEGTQVDLEPYHGLGTAPTVVYHRKERHEAAVFMLLECIEEALPPERVADVAAASD